MLQALCGKWWCLTLRGLCALVAGIVAIYYPTVTIEFIILLIGISSLIDGLACVFMGFGGGAEGRPWWEMILLGLIGVGVGIAAFVAPGALALAGLMFLAGWSIARGVMEIVIAFRIRHLIEDEWLLGLSGAMSILFGTLLLAKPGTAIVAIGMVIGIFLVFIGATAIALSLRLRAVQQRLSHA